MKKSLLVISNKVPYPPDGGDTSRLFQFVKYLARDWIIDFIGYERFRENASLVNATNSRTVLADLCRSVEIIKLPTLSKSRLRRYFDLLTNPSPSSVSKYYSTWMLEAINASFRRNTYNSILLSSLPMAQFISSESIQRYCVYDQVDAYYPLHFEAVQWVNKQARLYTFLDAFKMKKYERSILTGHFGKNIVVAENDANALRKLSPSIKVEVVPCGVDTTYFSPMPGEISNRLVFTGTMSYGPNIDAMVYFCRDILPLIAAKVPDVKLYIVGHSVDAKIDKLSSERIIVTGRVPDVRSYLASASVIIAPFRVGSGMHVKNLEAMAMEKPLVATDRGIQGIDGQAGRDFLVSNSSEGFANAVVELFSDGEFRRSLGQSGRLLVLNLYSNQNVGMQINNHLLQVSNSGLSSN